MKRTVSTFVGSITMQTEVVLTLPPLVAPTLRTPKSKIVEDLLGRPVEVGDLPSPNDRWTQKKKLILISALADGLITASEAQKKYSLSADELNSWVELYDTHGLSALRSTYIRDYRDQPSQ